MSGGKAIDERVSGFPGLHLNAGEEVWRVTWDGESKYLMNTVRLSRRLVGKALDHSLRKSWTVSFLKVLLNRMLMEEVEFMNFCLFRKRVSL